jgi:RimJ/RimL family protein N-acetyltransferase
VLQGRHIRLEPLDHRHVDALVAAAAVDPSLYQWSPVPQGKVEARTYIETALAWQDAGTAVPFAIISLDDNVNDGVVIGSTRFWNLERWAWPQGHPRHGRSAPDACEIGYTWLTRSAIRTAVNTEAKLLMLTHAFETWQVLRVCFHTDARNRRSRAALERIGGKFEGILRRPSHGGRSHSSRLGTLFDRGGGVGRGEGAAGRIAESSVIQGWNRFPMATA